MEQDGGNSFAGVPGEIGEMAASGKSSRGEVLFGNVPEGKPMEPQQSPGQFDAALLDALKAARDHCGGRYCIAVFTADASFDNLSLLLGRGPAWSDSKAFILAYQTFVGEFLKVTPGMLAAIQRPLETPTVQIIERVDPQATFGPLPPAAPPV